MMVYVWLGIMIAAVVVEVCTAQMVSVWFAIGALCSFFVALAAVTAPGLTTPIIGISISFSICSKAYALAVLQAITMAFTFWVFKNRTICLEYLVTVSFDLLPYGTLAVSPK